MAKFSIYSGLCLVGYSSLEEGDPPMGVAFGEFEPAIAYSLIQNECRTNHLDQTGLALSVKTEEGMAIPCDGVAILDYEDDLSGFIEITLLGVPSEFYEKVFPEQVNRHLRQFC